MVLAHELLNSSSYDSSHRTSYTAVRGFTRAKMKQAYCIALLYISRDATASVENRVHEDYGLWGQIFAINKNIDLLKRLLNGYNAPHQPVVS